MTHRRRLAAALLLLLTALTLLPAAAARADSTGPDTTPPQINLDPCHGTSPCRLVRAEVYGDLAPGDDLAVLGARVGDQVLAEHVYDDGTGFRPYGGFGPYGSDVVGQVDYALSVTVPKGTSDITFYARDLAGNESDLTTTVLGPIPPGPVTGLHAVLAGPRRVEVGWAPADLNGAVFATYAIATSGHALRTCQTAIPDYGPCGETYGGLERGWHRFAVAAVTAGGVGPAQSVRVFVPGRHHHAT